MCKKNFRHKFVLRKYLPDAKVAIMLQGVPVKYLTAILPSLCSRKK